MENNRDDRPSLDFTDLDFTTPEAQAAFREAVADGNTMRVCQAIGEGADPNQAGPDGTPPLSIAAGRGNERMVQLLIDAWSDVERLDALGDPPLRHAARRDNPDGGDFASTCLRIMLEGGADPDSRGRDGKTAIHAAFDARATDAMATLAANGADANMPPTGRMRSPLWLAVSMEDEVLVKSLLGHGTDLDRRGQDGRTVLHGAAENGMASICRLLLDAGADPMAKGADGETPIDLGLSSGNRMTVALFEAAALSDASPVREGKESGAARRI